MDDYSVASLTESKNEWCARLVNTVTPAMVEGLRSIFKEAWDLCAENEEEEKYLMTFQTFLSRIPKWNSEIIETERKRIEDVSSCSYLEDLVTCVHVIQLKALTCVRVGQKQKKIDIDVPSANAFIHKAYVDVARKLYSNVYLFEKDIAPLQIQKNNRELELIVRESIMNAVRATMPVEEILRAYMDETEEQNVEVTETVETVPEPVVEKPDEQAPTATAPVEKSAEVAQEPTPESNNDASSSNSDETENIALVVKTDTPAPPPTTPEVSSQAAVPDKVTFNNIDSAVDSQGKETTVSAPKTVERLEQIAEAAAQRRREEEEEEDEDTLQIGGDVKLDIADVNDLNKPSVKLQPPPALEGVEVLGAL